MPKLRWSSRAAEDLIEIWNHVAAENRAAADRLIDRIGETCARLEYLPRLGPTRADIAPHLRFLVIRPYLVFYLEEPGGVLVVRVVHGSRELSLLFADIEREDG